MFLHRVTQPLAYVSNGEVDEVLKYFQKLQLNLFASLHRLPKLSILFIITPGFR